LFFPPGQELALAGAKKQSPTFAFAKVGLSCSATQD
jgi:hypothetical protein